MTKARTIILALAVAALAAGTLPAGESLLVTGQTTYYQVGDDPWWKKGLAFSYQTADPAGNGEVVTVDNVTGLIWASEWDGAGCNHGGVFNWQSAVEWANNLTFAGYSDWRLPNIRELLSIVNYENYDPAINSTYFPGTRQGYYWSSTSYKRHPTRGVWCVDFRNGHADGDAKRSLHSVRAVRGGSK